jgi:hypothetical protein
MLSEAALEGLDVNLRNEKEQRAVDMMKSRNSQSFQLVAAFNSLIKSLTYEM